MNKKYLYISILFLTTQTALLAQRSPEENLSPGTEYTYMDEAYKIAGFESEKGEYFKTITLWLERPITFLNMEFARKLLKLQIRMDQGSDQETVESLRILDRSTQYATKTYVLATYIGYKMLSSLLRPSYVHIEKTTIPKVENV